MAHFGLLSLQGSGHLNPLLALSQRLVQRGHRVTVFQHHELEQKIRDYGVEFFPLERSSYVTSTRSKGWLSDTHSRLHRVDQDIQHFLRVYPAALRATGVDALLIGEISLAAPTIAEMLRIPYFLLSTGIPHHFGWTARGTLYPHRSLGQRLRTSMLEVSVRHMRGPLRFYLDRHRKRLGLSSLNQSRKVFPELAHITQWPRCLDRPRHHLPENFFYTGPFQPRRNQHKTAFPWERLNGRPMIYVSLGTTRKGDPSLLQRIAEACDQLNVQAVITLGGSGVARPCLSHQTIVVDNAPQQELLQYATAVVTHAGPNTALESLLHGKPMLALPLALDQPAVATALVQAGAAEALPWQHRSTDDIREALYRIISQSHYREAAEALQRQLYSRDGAEEAAQIIEQRLTAFHQG